MVGTVITKKGVALIAKLLATEQQLVFTRAAVGTGSCPSGYDPAGMLDLGQYRMDGMIAGCEAEGEEATITFQVSSEDVEEGFIITEAGLYANDEDDGEILYAYLDLTGDPQYVYPKGGVVQKFAEIDFKTIIGQVSSVTAVISPSSLVTREVYEEGMAKKVTTAGGDIADTKVSTYAAIAEEYPEPAAGDTMTTIMGKVVKFIRDAKAGFCRKSELVDNCTSSDTDKPPTAKQAKVLWDKITAAVTALTTHKSSGDHDGRYYTETEVNNLLAAKVSKSDLVNNCTSTATDKAPTAYQVKVLMDKYNQLNGDLGNRGRTYWSGPENIWIPAGTWVNGKNYISLPAGSYIVSAHAELPAGDPRAYISISETNFVEQYVSIPSHIDVRRATVTFVAFFDSTKSIRVRLFCDAAVTATLCEISAIRIS